MKFISLDGLKLAYRTIRDWGLFTFAKLPSADKTDDLGKSNLRYRTVYCGRVNASEDVLFGDNLSMTALNQLVGELTLELEALREDYNYIKNQNAKCVGFFLSEDSLMNYYPTPVIGDWAYVGNAFPVSVYVCKQEGIWEISEITFDGGSIELGDYATKEYVHNRFSLISEEQYEIKKAQGALDENTLYMSPEED